MISSYSNIFRKLNSDPESNIFIIVKEAKLMLGGLYCIYNKLNDQRSILSGITSDMDVNDLPAQDYADGHICFEATIAGLDKAIRISDLRITDYFNSDPNVIKFNLRSYLGVPVRIRNKIIGSLAIADTVVRDFTADEVEILNNLSLLIVLEEEHILTNKSLKLSEHRYHAVFENANDCLLLLNNNTIVDINETGCKMFGYDRKEIIGKTTVDLSTSIIDLSDITVPIIGDYINAALNGEPQRFEWNYKRKDGVVFYSEVSLSLLEGSDEFNIMAIARDISKQKQYEKDLIEAKEVAKESNRLKSLSLANMSHELRTPLNSIIGFSDLLLDEDTTEVEKGEFTKLIQSAGRSLMQLIADIIDISKIEAGEVTIQKYVFNVNSFLQEVLLTFNHEKEIRGKANIKLKLILSDDISELQIETDAHRLRQVFSNLLTNSLKFIEEGFIEFGYSSISLENVQFFVKDTGVGIGADKKDMIFEQYGQDKKTYNKNKDGTGLGLAISKSFVELLGGNIWVDSEIDKGSTFYFTIPLTSSSQQQKEKYFRNSLYVESVNWSQKVILIVDDVEQNYIYLHGLLSHTKAKIIWLKNGKEAVDFCNRERADMILMDIRMPVMDGFEASKIIKKEHPEILIVAQTAFSSNENRGEHLDGTFDGYITKPINYKSFFAILNKLFK